MEDPFKRLIPLMKEVDEARKKAEEASNNFDSDVSRAIEEDNRKRKEAFAERARMDMAERKALQEQIDRLKKK